jgi:predicted nucleotidyltransferase
MLTTEVNSPIENTLTDFKERLLALFPDGVEQIILFGSYARGEETADSDLDVLVVVDWTDPDAPDHHYLAKLVDPRWKAIMDVAIDVFIDQGPPFLSPLVIGRSLFKTNLEVAVNARQEGQVVWEKPES